MLDGLDGDGISESELASYYFISGTSHEVALSSPVASAAYRGIDVDASGRIELGEFQQYFSRISGLSSTSPNSTGVSSANCNCIAAYERTSLR